MNILFRIKTFLTNEQGQDLIEYALMAGFLCVSLVAILPNVNTNISTIFSKIASSLSSSASQGS